MAATRSKSTNNWTTPAPINGSELVAISAAKAARLVAAWGRTSTARAELTFMKSRREASGDSLPDDKDTALWDVALAAESSSRTVVTIEPDVVELVADVGLHEWFWVNPSCPVMRIGVADDRECLVHRNISMQSSLAE